MKIIENKKLRRINENISYIQKCITDIKRTIGSDLSDEDKLFDLKVPLRHLDSFNKEIQDYIKETSN